MEEKRRKKRRGSALAAALCAAVCLMTGGCSAAGKTLNRYSISSMAVFDTVTVITGYAENEAAFRETADRVLAELAEYHRVYDIYHNYEGIRNAKTVNDQAGGEPVAADPRLMVLMTLARDLCGKSGGRTDVTLGAVLRLWHEAREKAADHPETAAPPGEEALAQAAEHTGFGLLEMDPEKGTLRLTDPEASLDLGAVAKGYAVEQVCRTLESGWLVNVGGNVYATGPKPDGTPWTVGIQEPDGSGSDFLHTVTLEHGAVVTSGDYQRYFEAEGVRYHHLIDPETLRPGTRWRAVTVLHEDSGVADGLSTALFLMSREEGEKLLEMTGGEACWVAADGTVQCTPGYEERMR